MSVTIYLQFIGRVLRPMAGKQYGVILDPVGNLFIHGFPDADRRWTLDGETLSTERALPTQTVGAADTALTVTNTRSSIAPTGLLLDAAPYGAMLALAAGSGLVFFRKRRRED